jgi:hypothetical protein
VPLGIEDPDRLADIDEIVEIKALGDQCGTGRRAAFDILRSMIIDKASPFAGSCASAYALTLLKERYCMAGILEYMCGSQSRASRAYDGYRDHLTGTPIVQLAAHCGGSSSHSLKVILPSL